MSIQCSFVIDSQSINQEILKVASNKLLPGTRAAQSNVINKTSPGYESRNRCSFSRFLKVSRDRADCGGDIDWYMSFHMRALATER